jgi:hypothetical protein
MGRDQKELENQQRNKMKILRKTAKKIQIGEEEETELLSCGQGTRLCPQDRSTGLIQEVIPLRG